MRGKNLFWILLITLLILNLWTVVPSKAQEDLYPADVSIQPLSISWTYPEHDLLETFEVTLYIHNVTDLWGWQAGLYFNPDVLNVTYFKEGPFLKQGGATLWLKGTIDNTAGVTTYYSASLTLGSTPVNGSGDLAYIGFQVINYGNSTLDLTTTYNDPAELMLSDSNINEIPCDIYDGYFELPPPVHDITITSITPPSTSVYQGNTIDIHVEVKNKGDFTETFNVTAYYSNETLTPEQWETFWSLGDVSRDGYIDGIDVGLWEDAYGSRSGDWNWNPDADVDQDGDVDSLDHYLISAGYGLDIWTYFNILGGSIGRQTVNDLSPANYTALVFTWNTTGVPYDNYIIGARAPRVLGETDITNNAYDDGWVIVTIPGDIDGDGDVDSDDFYLFAGAYGSSVGDPAYNPAADLDSDGDVDSDDFYIFAGNYGKST